MGDSLDFDSLSFDEDELVEGDDALRAQGSSASSGGAFQDIASKYGLGTSQMSEEELKNFQSTSEYNQYKADVEESVIKPNTQGKTVQEILGLSNLKAGMGYSFNAFDHYDIDIEIYNDIYDTSPVMQDTVAIGETLLPTFKYLHQDIFLSLYKYKAKLLPETQMHLSTRLNHTFAESYLNTPEYITLRQSCRMDQFNAAIGTEIIGKKLLDIIREVMKKVQDYKDKMQKMQELMEKEKQMDTLLEENENLDELLEQMVQNGQGGSYDANALRQQMAENNATNAQLKAMANKLGEELDTLLGDDELAGEIARKSGTAFTEASLEVNEVSDLVQAWGLGEGEKCRVAFDNKKDAVEIIRKSKKLRDLTDLIGRFKESAITEQKKKVKNGAVEIKSVKNGKEIQDTLPSERMQLCNDITKGDFYRRYSEGQLLVYSKESNKEKNKGPIICCVDTSGSMNGSEELWSKALAIGVLEIAQMQKRDYACIIYDSVADNPIVISKNEISPEKIISIAETFKGGGTNFENPLKKALDLIKQSQFKDADILFITDGDCYVSDTFKQKFKAVKEEKEFKTMGVLVDMGGHPSDSSLKEFCDDVVCVSKIADLKDGESAVNKAIFGAL
jgi:uncharacterized protein with von Willebrand factor type A (vWA) domain